MNNNLPTADKIELNDAERQPCEIWTRVMGYHRPVASFNQGKQSEFHERQFFSEHPAQSIKRGRVDD